MALSRTQNFWNFFPPIILASFLLFVVWSLGWTLWMADKREIVDESPFPVYTENGKVVIVSNYQVLDSTNFRAFYFEVDDEYTEPTLIEIGHAKRYFWFWNFGGNYLKVKLPPNLEYSIK